VEGPPLRAVVEGPGDEAVARRLATETGFLLGSVYVKRGKSNLDPKLPAYAAAARHGAWLVLRDLDHDADCAPTLIETLLATRPPTLLLRVPVRSVEAWILADAKGVAEALAVPISAVPRDPEALNHPKRSLVHLARRSRSKLVRQDMLPQKGHSVGVGPGYTARLIEIATEHWNPARASKRSDSLARCLAALRQLSRRMSRE
jgi:hypothetical protein